ncbi:MAG: DUF2877 domain-containing protein [Lachnospiraceae bacterium]|nr:DUF2877 domain-containing protein [Lachnospiraceae bacterium]
MEIEILACVPKEIREILKCGMTGEVIMVNSSGIYLRFEEQIVFLCDITWGLVPIGIAVDGFKKMAKQLCLEEGQSVTFRDNTLIFPKGTVQLQMEEIIPEKECLRQPEKRYIKQAAMEVAALQKERGISMLVEPLVLGKKTNTVIQLNPYCAKAYPYLVKLMNALSHAEGEISYCVDKMLGLGTGLTPSADDVMLGMLYVFRKFPQKYSQSVCSFKENILELCDSHTNQVSSAYLKAIIQGAYFERMEQVWNGLCGMEPLDISKLTQVGSNSGTEMLLGMLVALRICGYDVSA